MSKRDGIWLTIFVTAGDLNKVASELCARGLLTNRTHADADADSHAGSLVLDSQGSPDRLTDDLAKSDKKPEKAAETNSNADQRSMLKALQLLTSHNVNVSPNNRARLIEWLQEFPDPARFLSRLLTQAADLNLTGDKLAGYVYNAVKTEVKNV